MSQPGFSRRAILVLTGMAAISLITGLVISLFQEEIGVVRSAGADAFSFSALGHRGFRELVESRGHPVLVSRSNSGFKTGEGGVLVVAEPDLITQKTQRRDKFWAMVESPPSVLVVLPKRVGAPDPRRPAHLEAVSMLPVQQTEAPLELLGIAGTVLRGQGHSRDHLWNQGLWQDRPFIGDLQLVEAENLEPLIATSRGILLGRLVMTEDTPEYHYFGNEILVLSDPDLLANHGLSQGNNAAIMLKILDFLTWPQGTVVFDETLHGHEVSPSLFRSLFRVPLVFVLMQVLLTALFLLWQATGRFGSPRPLEESATRGLDFLLDNTAELLEFGGHGSYVLGRYFKAATASVCRRLHLDLPGTGSRARERLVNITHTRSPAFDFKKMSRELPAPAGSTTVRNQKVLAMARAIWRWQREMTHGI